MNIACCYRCISKRYLETDLQNMTLNSERILLLTKSIPLNTLNPKKTLNVLSAHLSAGLSAERAQAETLSFEPKTQKGRKRKKKKKMEVAVVKWRLCPTSGNRMWFFSLLLMLCVCVCALVALLSITHTSLNSTSAVCWDISVTELLLTFWYRDVEVSESRIKTFTVTNKVSFNFLK